MSVSNIAIRILGRLRHVSLVAARGIEYRKATQILARPGTWIICVLFFVAATPFDLAQSGISYLLKVCAMLGMVAYAVLVRRARIGRLNLIAGAVIIGLFLTNLFGWSDRVLLALAAIVAGTLLGQTRGDKWNDEFQVVVFVYLAVHCVGLLVAASLFYSTNHVIELHAAIFPHESRAEAYGIIGRLSGFHNEPGTYSQWMIMALYLFSLTQGRIFNTWTAVIALSIVFTVSLWGIIAFGVISAAFAIEILLSSVKRKKVQVLFSLILFVGVITIIAINISSNTIEQWIQFMNIKSEISTQSGLDKLYAIEFMRQEFWNVFLLGRPFDPGFCPKCISPQDAGIGMTGTYYFGFLPFASLIIVLATRVYSRWGLSFVVPIALMLVWKAHIYEPLFWVIIGYALTEFGNRRKQLV